MEAACALRIFNWTTNLAFSAFAEAPNTYTITALSEHTRAYRMKPIAKLGPSSKHTTQA